MTPLNISSFRLAQTDWEPSSNTNAFVRLLLQWRRRDTSAIQYTDINTIFSYAKLFVRFSCVTLRREVEICSWRRKAEVALRLKSTPLFHTSFFSGFKKGEKKRGKKGERRAGQVLLSLSSEASLYPYYIWPQISRWKKLFDICDDSPPSSLSLSRSDRFSRIDNVRSFTIKLGRT